MLLAEVEFSETMFMPGDMGGECFRHYVAGQHVDTIELNEGSIVMKKGRHSRNYALWFVKSWTPLPPVAQVRRRKVSSG